MKLYDVSRDSLYHIFKQVPLEKRLSLRQVSNQWTATVVDHCKTQKELTLQIGSQNKWKEAFGYIHYAKELIINAANSFDSLTADYLSKELTTFLTTTFPRLETLVVIVDDPTEDVDFLRQLPQLISAFADTLITLQLIWNVKNDTFQAIFHSLIASIDGLYRLQELSFYDASAKLEVLPFVLPNLMSTSLDILDFHSFRSSNVLACFWVPSLQVRTKPTLMEINFFACAGIQKGLLSVHKHLAKVGKHFEYVPIFMKTADEMTHFTSAFTNLTAMWLDLSAAISVGSALTQLAKLQFLTELKLGIEKQQQTVYSSNFPAPVFSALLSLKIFLEDPAPLQHAFMKEVLRPDVFPNLDLLWLFLYNNRCASCQWKIKEPINDGHAKIEGSDEQVEQCVKLLVTPFEKIKPDMQVSIETTCEIGILYWVDFFDNDGQVKLKKIDTSNITKQ